MRVVETVPGSNPTAMHPQQTQLQPLAAPQTPAPAPVAPTTNGLKPDQLAQLGQLTPIRPPMQEPQMVTMNVNQQQQQIPVMGQQGVVRGQLVQVPAPQQQQQVIQQQQPPLLHLPRHPLPVLRPGQPAQQQPTTVVVTQQQQIQQPQQLQIQQKGQMGGSIIITTTPSSVQQQQYQQQHQPQQLQIQQVVQQSQQPIQMQQLQPQQLQQQPQQVQTVYQPQQQQIRPAIVQGMVRPAVPQQQQQQQQPAPQHPAGSQQVQLRVSNDDANRQFCLSWLKATYELSAGSSIEQQVMYKQYLASLHKLGKREVISAQHYAVCVR
jgi:hypothetical protein